MTTRGTIVDEPGNGTVEIFSLPTDETTLVDLVTAIFTDWWEHIHFGVIVQGAAWEVAAPNAPVKISTLDGYITVDFGRWHFHLCLGEHTASGAELGRIRRCSRAELYRILRDGKPGSWGLRLFNSEGTQLMTVLFPHPWLDDTQHPLPAADWDRLQAWDAIRERFLGIGADPLDRTGTGFRH
jgi:hypothetical protein